MVGFWVCESCYCIVVSEGDFDICVFKQVDDSAYVWGGEGESCQFHVVICVCRWCGAHYLVLYLPC